jgi:hypothetical protein
MRRANLIGCAVLSILLTSPVTTWAGSCPEGQKWNDRQGECVKDKTSSSKKKSVPLKKLSEVAFSISGHPIDFKARRARFLELAAKGDDKRDWYCENLTRPVELAPTVEIFGESRATVSNPNPVEGQSTDPFMESLYALLASYVYGKEGAAEMIYDGLLEGARTDAYSVITADASADSSWKWDEPTYYASMILWPLGYAYVLLVDEYGEDDPGVKEIKAWGDRLYVSSESKKVKWIDGSFVKGADRAGLKAAAYSIWGNATGNEEALRKGYWYFRHAMKTVGRGGKDIHWGKDAKIRKMKKTLKYVGMTTGPALYAAYALSLSGAENAFEESPKGGDIKEGMAWLIKRAFETKDKISTKNRSHSEGMGYAELFIKLFPKHSAAKLADSKLARSKGGIVTIHIGGGPATCLIRQTTKNVKGNEYINCDTPYLGIINTTEALCKSKHKGKVVEGVTCKTSFAVIETATEEECTAVFYGEVLSN